MCDHIDKIIKLGSIDVKNYGFVLVLVFTQILLWMLLATLHGAKIVIESNKNVFKLKSKIEYY